MQLNHGATLARPKTSCYLSADIRLSVCPSVSVCLYPFLCLFRLMRPVSKKWAGTPYQLVKALPVDMFPHTDKCELVLLFSRDKSDKITL